MMRASLVQPPSTQRTGVTQGLTRRGNNRDYEDGVFYPSSDGKPMANETEHFEWITMVKEGLTALFADNPNVLVVGDLLWYPVKGHPRITVAPDVMVVVGRPAGARRSYKQWQEDNTPPHVVFEFLSPSNTDAEMAHKAAFFDKYGVEEYYLYDIETGELSGLMRYSDRDSEEGLEMIPNMHGWVSPRLGIRFEMEHDGLVIYKPNGERFESFLQVTRRLEQSQEQLAQSISRAETAESRAQTLAEKLRSLGINPEDIL